MRRANGMVAWIFGSAAMLQIASAANWVSTGPYGGRVAAIYTRAGAPDLVFALTAGGLYRSNDGGDHWARAEAGVLGTVNPTTYGLSGDLLAFDPLDAQAAYLVDADGVLYRTVDTGEHWIPTGYALSGATPLTLAVDASVPRRLYLGTSSGIMRSIDGGVSFAPASDGLPGGFISGIAIDPSDEQHVIAGGGYGPASPAFFHSNDAAEHWLPGQSPCESLSVCDFVHDLRFGGNSHAFAVVIGFVFASFDGVVWGGAPVFEGRVTTLSTNGAQAFLIGGTFGTGFTTDEFSSANLLNEGLAIDGATPLQVLSTNLFPGYPAPGPWFAGTYIAGLFRSDDAGTSWQAHSEGLAATSIRALAFDPNDSSHVLAGDSTGAYSFEGGRALYASTDGGGHWSPVAVQPPARYIRALAYDPTTNGTIYAAGLWAGQPFVATPNSGIYKSTNGGAAWSILDGGLPLLGDPPSATVGSIQALTIDRRSCAEPPPTGPCTSGPLQTLYASASGVYLDAGYSYRVIKSVDAGATWSSADVGLPQPVYVGANYESAVTGPLQVDPENSAIVYLGTFYAGDVGPSDPGIQNGVFRSDDGGEHWTFRSDGLPRYPGSTNAALDVVALAIHPTRSGMLWAGLADEYRIAPAAVYKTVDGGAHWTDSSSGLALAAVGALIVDASDPDTLYAGGNPLPGSRVTMFRSSDGGASWTPMVGAPPTQLLHSLALDPADRTHLLAGTSAGVWTTTEAIFADGFESRRSREPFRLGPSRETDRHP